MLTPLPALATAAVPAALLPMWLPRTRLPVAPAPVSTTPLQALPEITLRAAAAVPPIVLPAVWISMPAAALAMAAVPAAFRPM